jgi:WD40 repeat protein/serine/threonine protein kinase/tetratricopeptide (TPR) repeat protein
VVEEATRKLQRGEPLDIDDLAARHPEQAEILLRLLPALREIVRWDWAAGRGPAAGELVAPGPIGIGSRLGEFRLVGELGRGGMGIVFEAVQESLGRRVALKVLPTASALDSRAQQRFQIEVQAAACLQHPHIVPVYAVGMVDAIPYAAMQLIEGKSLVQLIGELRRALLPDAEGEAGIARAKALDPLAVYLLSGRFNQTGEGLGSSRDQPDSAATTWKSRTPQARLLDRSPAEPIIGSVRSPAYFHSVARLGIEAALALDYAHGQGIIHRDIKPANLLLDGHGRLWVTDFGLARLPGDAGLTLTGELLGTPRYMSPEQAGGKRALVDRRSDIYSLGVTLYELLCLRPAVDGDGSPEVLRRIAEHDPSPVRALNRAVPPDLATVVAKAMAKDPADRYVTAQHLADDLACFVAGRPVSARPEPVLKRTLKWARRRPLLTALLLLVQVLGLAVVVLGGWSYRSMSREAQANRRRAESEYQAHIASQRTSAALALDRGIDLADGHHVGRGLLWMLRSLESAPPKEADDLRRVALTNLAAWGEALPVPRAVLVSPNLSPVAALALSPDGRTVAVGSDDGELALWDTDTAQRLDSAQAPHGGFTSIVFHPQGRFLATRGQDGLAQLWDSAPLKPRGRPIQVPRWMTYIRFHPAGLSFLATGPNGVQLRNLLTGRAVGAPLGIDEAKQTQVVLGGALIGPGGDRILTYGGDGYIRVWETATGRLAWPAPLHEGNVVAAEFSPDGRRLASTSDQGLRVWDAENGRLIAETSRSEGRFSGVTFSPDGETIMATASAGVVQFFDAATGRARGSPMTFPRGLGMQAFRPDGRLLAGSGVDGNVRFFDASTGREVGPVLEHSGRIMGLVFRPDGRRLLTAGRDGSAQVWDVTPLAPAARGLLWAGDARSVEFSPDGRLLATDGLDGAARVFDVATGRPALPPLVHSGGRVRVARFSPDGRLLATGGDDSLVRLWDAATGAAAGPPLVQPHWPLNVRFSPDGRKLLVGTAAGAARLWDLETFRAIGPILSHPVTAGREIWNLAFDPRSRVAVTGTTLTGGTGATVGFWDAATGQSVAPFLRFAESIAQFASGPGSAGPLYIVEGGRVHTLDLTSFAETRPPFGQRIEVVALLPGGKTMLGGGADRTARFWDVSTGRPIGPMLEHEDVVRGVAVAPTGAIVATLAGERLRFWGTATGKPLGPPMRHAGAVPNVRSDDRMPVAFRPDSRFAVSVGGAVLFWPTASPNQSANSGQAATAEWVRDLTGMVLNEGGDFQLQEAEHWRSRLAARDTAYAVQANAGAGDWHDRLAAESERLGDRYAHQWHLDHLVAARPDDWTAYARRASGRRRSGDQTGAAADALRAREIGPAGLVRAWEAHDAYDQATEARSLGRWALVRTHLGRFAAIVDEDPALAFQFADADCHLRRWDEAEAELSLAVDSLGRAGLESASHQDWHGWLAALRVRNGHLDRYRADCRRLLNWAGACPTPSTAAAAAWHCAIGPDGLDDPFAPVRLAEAALGSATAGSRPTILAALGAALYRAGQFDDAIVRLEEAEGEPRDKHPQILALLAMANQAQGRTALARRWLDRLRSRTPSPSTERDSLSDHLEVEVLQHEAEAVVLLDPVFPANPFAP